VGKTLCISTRRHFHIASDQLVVDKCQLLSQRANQIDSHDQNIIAYSALNAHCKHVVDN
jgi:hypothetical protein